MMAWDGNALMGPRLYCTIFMFLMFCFLWRGREARIRLEVGSKEAQNDNDEMNRCRVGFSLFLKSNVITPIFWSLYFSAHELKSRVPQVNHPTVSNPPTQVESYNVAIGTEACSIQLAEEPAGCLTLGPRQMVQVHIRMAEISSNLIAHRAEEESNPIQGQSIQEPVCRRCN